MATSSAHISSEFSNPNLDVLLSEEQIGTRIAELFASHLDLVILPPPVEIPTFTIALSWHERNHHAPAQRWFRDQVISAAE